MPMIHTKCMTNNGSVRTRDFEDDEGTYRAYDPHDHDDGDDDDSDDDDTGDHEPVERLDVGEGLDI